MTSLFLQPHKVPYFQVTEVDAALIDKWNGEKTLATDISWPWEGYDWNYIGHKGNWSDYLVKLPDPVGIVVMTPEEFDAWLGVHPATREKALTELARLGQEFDADLSMKEGK